MTIKTVVPSARYHTVSRKGFENVQFSDSSETSLVYPKGIDFVSKIDPVNPFTLESLAESVVFRAEAVGTPEQKSAELYRNTRTTAVYLRDGAGTVLLAFDDSIDGNLVLSLAQEGYKLNSKTPFEELLLPKSDARVKAFLERAKKRTHKSPGNSFSLSLQGEYSRNKTVKDMLGDSAKVNAQYLRKRNCPEGYVGIVPDTAVIERAGTDHVLVRPCGLGGDDYYNIDNVYANDQFNNNGRARGIVIASSKKIGTSL